MASSLTNADYLNDRRYALRARRAGAISTDEARIIIELVTELRCAHAARNASTSGRSVSSLPGVDRCSDCVTLLNSVKQQNERPRPHSA
jgi:hypothetical protein